MNTKLCFVIPIYKETLSSNEQRSLNRCVQLYHHKYDIFLIKPKTLNAHSYKETSSFFKVLSFSDYYFKSSQTYNHLMLSPSLYKSFLGYRRIIIYQLDAFILSDSIEEMELLGYFNYDFIGAPWLDKSWIKKMDKKLGSRLFEWFFLQVGNGGLSLRNPRKSYWISMLFSPFRSFWKSNWNEDLFWSTICYRFVPGYKVAPLGVALNFAFEDNPKTALKLNNRKLPFGCHAWEKNDPIFWEEIFKKIGIK